MPSFSCVRFDSEALPEAARFPTYASGIANFALKAMGDGPFMVRAEAWRVGGLVLSRIATSRLIYDRTPAKIRAAPADHFYLNLHLSGRTEALSGTGTTVANDGSLLVVDMRRPIRLDVEVADQLSLAIPRRMLAPGLRGFDPHGLVLTGGMVPLLARTIQGVLASLPALGVRHGPDVEALLVGLAGRTLVDALRRRDTAGSEDPALAEKTRDWIEAHLGGPIQVEAICTELGVSRSRLYRALKGSGGVVALVQTCRLRRLRAFLEDPGENRSIAALARACGFADRTHLARAFKQSYATTPGAFRALARADGEADSPAPRRSASNMFADWVTSLG
jgi:AraC-like DNA-binding protein